MTNSRPTLAALRPPAGADEQVWAARITACWRASVEAIFEVGRLLAAAKEVLPHGKFGAMIESDLPFGERTAQMLMAIAADARITNAKHVSHLPASWGTLYELTKLPDDEFERCLSDGTIRPDMMRRDIVRIAEPMPEPSAETPRETSPPPPPPPQTIDHDPGEPVTYVEARPEPTPEPGLPVPTGDHRGAHNAQRVEAADSLDYSPTPPWATRALFGHVLPHLGVGIGSAWDPACGEGHMTAVAEECVRGPVIGSDIFDYSRDGRMPAGWWRTLDFLDVNEETPAVDWIVTNPPFGDRVRPFMSRALDLARVGVAMFLQLRYLEGIDRYEAIYRDRPPTLFAPFTERVPLHMGRYEPDGSTMTAFMWLVWVKDREPVAPLWIPPGRRAALRLDGDDERFTEHPVTGMEIEETLPDHDPETGELSPEPVLTEDRSTAPAPGSAAVEIPGNPSTEIGSPSAGKDLLDEKAHAQPEGGIAADSRADTAKNQGGDHVTASVAETTTQVLDSKDGAGEGVAAARAPSEPPTRSSRFSQSTSTTPCGWSINSGRGWRGIRAVWKAPIMGLTRIGGS